MRIDQQTVFRVYFTYEGTELMMPVSANDEQAAKMKLRGFLLQWANELVTDASVLSPIQRRETPMPTSAGIPVELPPVSDIGLSLRIEELVKDCMSIKKPAGAQPMDKLIKTWTGFPYEPQNYAAIIEGLEKIKAGK